MVKVRVRTQEQIAAIGERGKGGRIALQDFEAKIAEPKVGDNLLAEKAIHIGRRRNLEARKHLLGHAGAADKIAALQNQHLPSLAGQVTSGHQAVVPGPNNDSIVRIVHWQFLNIASWVNFS